MSTDIFCKVIDNYGDIGVSWRLARQLRNQYDERVRLIVDDASALTWMAQDSEQTRLVEVLSWHQADQIDAPADVVIEAFGCEIPNHYIKKMALQAKYGKTSRWINLEYLTAEKYAEQCHLLPSPVMHGEGRGLSKTFFYPGFARRTGGLLREPNLPKRQAVFSKQQWLKAHKIDWHGERIVSLFCYEPVALGRLIEELQCSSQSTLLIVTAGRAEQAINALNATSHLALQMHYLPHLTQDDYDHLLWASDFNFVRGEDSLVRAIWAGKPFVWQIYPQHDNAHHTKLKAFLDVYLEGADTAISAQILTASRAWNAISPPSNWPRRLIPQDLHGWQSISFDRSNLWANQPDLVSQLNNLLRLPYFQSA